MVTDAETVRGALDDQLSAMLSDLGQRVATGGQINTDDVVSVEALQPPGKAALGRRDIAHYLLSGSCRGALGALRAAADDNARVTPSPRQLLTALDSDLADLVAALGRRFALGSKLGENEAAAAAELLPAGKSVFDHREGAFAMCAGAQLGALGALQAIRDVKEGRERPPGHHPGWPPGR